MIDVWMPLVVTVRTWDGSIRTTPETKTSPSSLILDFRITACYGYFFKGDSSSATDATAVLKELILRKKSKLNCLVWKNWYILHLKWFWEIVYTSFEKLLLSSNNRKNYWLKCISTVVLKIILKIQINSFYTK